MRTNGGLKCGFTDGFPAARVACYNHCGFVAQGDLHMHGDARKKLVAKDVPKRGSRTGSAHQIGLLPKGEKLRDVLVIAQESGLLRGTRTRVVRGRMPEALVNKAKSRTGITSDTDLLEVALANLAVADDYPEWLLSRRGRIGQDVDIEF
jgi:hypothetical protein